MRSIFIGDVHGCLDELVALLALCRAAASDRVIVVGDLVAKGPDSRGVIALARERRFLGVRGNHDDKVLRLRDPATRDAGPADHRPHHARVADTLDAADWDYLSALPLWLDFPELDALAVHGGLVPGRAPEDHQPHELMNVRSIGADGHAHSRVDAGTPWASLYQGPRHAVFGHDAIRGLQRHAFATGVDTGCVYGRALTALILPERRLVSVPARRAYTTPGKDK